MTGQARAIAHIPLSEVEPSAEAGTALDAALNALCVALGDYLRGLRSAWHTPGGHDGGEIDTLIAGIGGPAPDDPAVRADFQRHTASVTGPASAVRAEPLLQLGERLSLDLGERLLTAAVWWAETEPQFAVLLGCGHDDGSRRYASAALLRLLLGRFDVVLPPALEDADPLVRLGVLEPGAGTAGQLLLTPTARRVLAGLSTPIATQRQDGLHQRVAGLLVGGGAVLLRGRSDRDAAPREVAGAAARELGLPLADGTGRSDAELRLLGRLGRVLPLVSAERLPDLAWSTEDGQLLALGGPGTGGRTAHVVDVLRPGPRSRAASWVRELTGAGMGPAIARTLADRLGARFTFDDADIRLAVGQAVRESTADDRKLESDDVWAAARSMPAHDLSTVAALVEPSYTLDDLVLPGDVRTQLDEVVAHVSLQDVVLDRWGFRDGMPRGQGVAVLMSGPPGTGKTMAAEGLANALGQDLYRIDLSMVVSKYIGETEKNLAIAFDEAERAAAVLFFDECDALFGQRTEQRDAHDRWANLEVNFLLQRVETFTGLVLLATNKRQALDQAFLRRLRFSIRFELPDADARGELWRRSFPDAAPREDLDIAALSGRELAGGSVRNTALAAAFGAAAAGVDINAGHIAHALRREYDKLGKVWTEG